MPRGVSSEKITTFAIGATGFAIGTTIAMPFAVAGAGAVLGAFGTEAGVHFNVIAAGLTGVEVLASNGAIGAQRILSLDLKKILSPMITQKRKKRRKRKGPNAPSAAGAIGKIFVLQ